jgi:hypothetical protein
VRALAIGKRGTGKTNRLRCAARALLAASPDLFCVYLDNAKPTIQYPGEVVDKVTEIAPRAERLMRQSQPVPREWVVRRDTAGAAAAFALSLPKCILVLDELKHRDCLGSSEQALPVPLADVLFYGTTVDVLATTQRLAKLNTDLPSLADVLWVHHLSSDYDGFRLEREGVSPDVIADCQRPDFGFAYHVVML